MHINAKRIFITIFCLILLSLALLGINFLANGFYEARFYLPENYYKQLNTVVTIPNDYGNEPSLWRSAPGFIDEFLPGHSLSEIFTNYATIRSSSGWVTITVYAKNNSAISDLNKLINLQYKDISSTKNSAKLQKIAEDLKALEQQIAELKNNLINNNSTNQIIERQAADKYIEAFIAAAQSQEILRYVQDNGASLALPIIAHDPEIKRLVSLKHCAEVRLLQLNAAGRGSCVEAKIIGQQKITLEQKINAQIKAIITRLKSQAQLDQAMEQHLKKFLGEKTKSSPSNVVSFKQLENLLQQKLQLLLEQQSLNNEAEVSNMIIVKIHPQISYIWLLFLLSAVILILSALPFIYKKLDKKMLHSRKTDIIDLSELAQLINGKPHGAVAFFAQQAESAAAKFIMYLRKVIGLKLRIVLLDFSGKVINKYTNNTKGIKDVLSGDADFSQIIYHDSTIDIDIIMADGIGELDATEKRQRFRHIMVNCYQNYDLIIYSVSEEVEVPINSFLPKDTTIVVVCSAFDAYDAKNWAKVLRSVGFRLIHFLKLA